ncbi:hypothetical protein BSKO_09763 [Bryopsis sp. KO-2023]|nr:hypothetical protein BSKO_09763 [Bryopsis sp. KO-2023]
MGSHLDEVFMESRPQHVCVLKRSVPHSCYETTRQSRVLRVTPHTWLVGFCPCSGFPGTLFCLGKLFFSISKLGNRNRRMNGRVLLWYPLVEFRCGTRCGV